MESGSLAARLSGAHWRLWALLPIVALVGVVAIFVSTGSSLLELVGQNPPPADELDIRRVEFRPGEIKIKVTNPQRDDITIASVTVDDAIVPYSLDGDRTLERLRSSTVVIPYDWVDGEPLVRRRDELERDRDLEGDPGRGRDAPGLGEGILRLRRDRAVRRRHTGRARAGLAPVAPAGEPGVARRVHGAHRGTAHVPRVRGALRGVRAPGSASERARAASASSCSASPRRTCS